MTDKVQKIKEWIQTRKLCTMDEHMKFYCKEAESDYNLLCSIEKILDSMQEETVISVWHDASEIPEVGKKLLLICYSGNAYAGYHHSISHASIKKWAYIDDLLKL